MANETLFVWGVVEFKAVGLSPGRYRHHEGTDFARKDVMETIPRREFVGERDEEIHMRGRMAPLLDGSWGTMEALRNQRRAGQAHKIFRGSARSMRPLGWFVCEEIANDHEFILPNGIGRVIDFDVRFARVDPPMAATYYQSVFSAIQSL